MLWDTLWQYMPLVVLALSATTWMVRDLVQSTRTARRSKTG
ncbi:hypothetical protein ACFFQW_48020 [Umezawaea endophytica]|uniref:Uncharacterized protein n=1 Tax=Umezawaea endophytica TaxID=1654476 RepID=A0A9X3AJ47_9PSEU|nr:hypothetical protein [Umezawaea endophytica]MCS7483496.1 hypothetical protein [Umezawaea endophytica]